MFVDDQLCGEVPGLWSSRRWVDLSCSPTLYGTTIKLSAQKLNLGEVRVYGTWSVPSTAFTPTAAIPWIVDSATGKLEVDLSLGEINQFLKFRGYATRDTVVKAAETNYFLVISKC